MKMLPLMAAYAVLPCLQAAIITLPNPGATATSPDASINPNVSVNAGLLITADIDNTHSGTATSGSWSASATGSTSIKLVDILSTTIAGVNLLTETRMTSSAIYFNTITLETGLAGDLLAALNLEAIVSAGLTQQWLASVNLTTLGLTVAPSTTYDLTFGLEQSTSLFGDISPAVFNYFSVAVADASATYPVGFLGITDLFASYGIVTLTFTTGAVIDGDVIASFWAEAVADTDLLDGVLGEPSTTLYTITALNIIPEPGTMALVAVFGGLMLFHRRRRI